MTEETINTPQPVEAAPVEQKNTECKSKLPLWLIILNGALLLGVAALFVLFFMSKPSNKPGNTNSDTQNLTFAFINTDSIWSLYPFVVDMNAELAAYEKNLQDQYSGRMAAFEKEYNDYLKKGTSGQLSLDEQKKTEEKLAKKQQELTALDADLTKQLMAEKEKRNMEVHDTIVSYIARYNKSKNYSFIFERSYGGTLLYANPAFEITNDILKGLNEEYPKVKENRQKQKSAN